MNKSTHFHAKGQSHCESIAERDTVAHPATLLAPRTGPASQRETRASRIRRHETNPHSLPVKRETRIASKLHLFSGLVRIERGAKRREEPCPRWHATCLSYCGVVPKLRRNSQ